MILKLSIFRYCKPYALIYLEGGMFVKTSGFPICIFKRLAWAIWSSQEITQRWHFSLNGLSKYLEMKTGSQKTKENVIPASTQVWHQ